MQTNSAEESFSLILQSEHLHRNLQYILYLNYYLKEFKQISAIGFGYKRKTPWLYTT